jgi:hypothetical protein
MEEMEENAKESAKPEVLEAVKLKEAELREGGQGKGLMEWFK